MHLDEIIEISKKKSEEKLIEIRDRLTIPFFKAKEQSHWDCYPKKIVVIGSGIGGMASAALFAKIGHKVNVLEMNKELIGGHGRCPTYGGMRYSMGPQYVWEFGDGMLGDRFLQFLGLKESDPFLPMKADGFERIFVGDKKGQANYFFADFKVPLGLSNFHRKLKSLFPEEGQNLDALFDDMIAVFDTYKSYLRKNSFAEGRFLLATKFLLTSKVHAAMKINIGRAIYMSLTEWFDQYKISNIVRRIIYGHGGIFAENEAEMSAIAFIIGTGNYHSGAWFPKNGFFHFFDSMSSVIRTSGGSVETGKRVVRLETTNTRVTKAICEDSTIYECDFIFSDVSPRITSSLLGTGEEKFEYSPSRSIPTCCLGIKGGLESIADMKGRNYWWQNGNEVNYDNPDVTNSPQMLFIGSPTASGFGRIEGGTDDALVMFCPGNYHQEKKIYKNGPEAVRQFKQKLADDIVDILDRNVHPGIKSKLKFAEIISSIDIENDTDGELGNAYGRRLSVDEIHKGTITEENCPQNLYNVSATKNSAGIAGGIFTAELLFEELTGKKILKN